MDLEDEARERLFQRLHQADVGHLGARGGGDFHEGVQQLLHPEIVQRRTEEDRLLLSGEVFFEGKFRIDPLDQFQVVPQAVCSRCTYQRVELRVVEPVYLHGLFHLLFLGTGEQADVAAVEVVDAFEFGSHPDGEAHRAQVKPQFLLRLVHHVERIPAFAVQFVDKDDHRNVAHAAHPDQFFGLFLHTFGYVDHHDHTVHRGERAVGVLCEILVPRGVEDVDLVTFVFESHHRSGYRDASLAFDLHKVRSRAFFYLVRFDRPRLLDRSGKEQQFFRQGGFTRVGVRNDAESAAARRLLLESHTFVEVLRGANLAKIARTAAFLRKAKGKICLRGDKRIFLPRGKKDPLAV